MHDFYTNLNTLELLEISGEDSEKFLQGQLTCDLQPLEEDCWLFGAACNNKGRTYTSFRLLKNKGRFIMLLQPGMTGITENTLRKYIPFYKAGMASISSQYQRTGYVGKNSEMFLAEQLGTLPVPGRASPINNGLVLNLSQSIPRFEVWLASGSKLPIPPPEHIPYAAVEFWQQSELQDGFCLIRPEFVESYTPEELNMDLAGFISFNKGCYTGQEIVARMHFRGKAKKRMYLATISGNFASTITDEASDPTLEKSFNQLILNDYFFFNIVLPSDYDTSQNLDILTPDGTVSATVSAYVYS